ncbi:MAG: hypothetical protein AAGF23_08155, partial [Acidobacteriota bacterium]
MRLEFCSAVASFFLLFLWSSAALAWTLSPPSAGPGDTVTLAGETTQTGDPFAVVLGPDGGAVIDDLEAVDGELRGSLGPVADPFVGHA